VRKPTVTECLIDIDLAIAIRELTKALRLKRPKGNLQFRCPECGYPVKPHEEGEDAAGSKDVPHFEHLPKHPANCKLSRKGNLPQKKR
jgi:hypothetical protein